MSIPYNQSCSGENDIPTLPYMRLPSYQSLHRRRYHPYATTRTRSPSGFSDMMEPAGDTDFEAEMRPVRADPISGPLSLTMFLEDDCMAGLRTVVSQMSGGDSTYMRLGSVHLVIDFAFIVRHHLRKRSAA